VICKGMTRMNIFLKTSRRLTLLAGLVLGLGVFPAVVEGSGTYWYSGNGSKPAIGVKSLSFKIWGGTPKGKDKRKRSKSLTAEQISPTEGFNTGLVQMEITGSGFRSEVVVSLSGMGGQRIEGKLVELVDADTIRCWFDLTARPAGTYDLTVTRTDGVTVALPQCFSVKVKSPSVAPVVEQSLPARSAQPGKSSQSITPSQPVQTEKSAPPDKLERLSQLSVNIAQLNQSLQPIYFDCGLAGLRRDQVVKVEHLRQILTDYPQLRTVIRINGYADARGSEAYNLILSQRRTETVRDYLIAQGVAPERIMVFAYGEADPAVEGEGEAVWSQNRRVEIILVEEETAALSES
jgi:outer membrane protein OmpA-like peptidoglycan-associated protein